MKQKGGGGTTFRAFSIRRLSTRRCALETGYRPRVRRKLNHGRRSNRIAADQPQEGEPLELPTIEENAFEVKEVGV
jgi:hypothetical protein